MIRIDEVDAFRIIPWKRLRFGKLLCGCIVVVQSDEPRVKVDCIPKVASSCEVGVSIWRIMDPGIKLIKLQAGFTDVSVRSHWRQSINAHRNLILGVHQSVDRGLLVGCR